MSTAAVMSQIVLVNLHVPGTAEGISALLSSVFPEAQCCGLLELEESSFLAAGPKLIL